VSLVLVLLTPGGRQPWTGDFGASVHSAVATGETAMTMLSVLLKFICCETKHQAREHGLLDGFLFRITCKFPTMKEKS
jgi:hypothetical protein